MPLPKPKVDVPRAEVGDEVTVMLMNQAVTELDVHQQPDKLFTIVPRGVAAGAAGGPVTMSRPSRRVSKGRNRVSKSRKRVSKRGK